MEYTKELIEKIKERYELPCYVFDELTFRKNYKQLLLSMRKYYPKYEIAYSYKTNYAPKLCMIVKELGGYAEVVSDMEYDIARKIGYQSKKIVYNGPFKGPEMEEHVVNEGILNIDNLEEVHRVIEIACKYNSLLKVGIRVNIDVGQKFVSRFGIDAKSDDLSLAVKMLRECDRTKLIGFHCHIGQARGLDAWKRRTEQLLELSDLYIDGIPEYIDLGSGMCGDMDAELKEQFFDVPSYEQYAQATAKLVAEHYKNVNMNNKPILFTEPGTTVDNKYVDLIAEIDSIKRINGQDLAVLNCSIHNLGDVALSVKLPIKVFSKGQIQTKYKNMNWVGYTCLERDVMYKGYSGLLGKGDYVVFRNVGGYSNVDKPPFILPQCAMVGTNGTDWYTIKRRETTEDILSTYII